jgi:hypothetical protein
VLKSWVSVKKINELYKLIVNYLARNEFITSYVVNTKNNPVVAVVTNIEINMTTLFKRIMVKEVI